MAGLLRVSTLGHTKKGWPRAFTGADEYDDRKWVQEQLMQSWKLQNLWAGGLPAEYVGSEACHYLPMSTLPGQGCCIAP